MNYMTFIYTYELYIPQEQAISTIYSTEIHTHMHVDANNNVLS